MHAVRGTCSEYTQLSHSYRANLSCTSQSHRKLVTAYRSRQMESWLDRETGVEIVVSPVRLITLEDVAEFFHFGDSARNQQKCKRRKSEELLALV